MKEIVVIILTYNQVDKTRRCLSRFFETGNGEEAHVLLWDNGSQDNTGALVTQAFPQVTVHTHDRNLGVASGRNAAAALAMQRYSPRYLLFLDNDILVEPGFVKVLHDTLQNDSRVGQAQAKLRFMHDRSLLNDAGGARINFLLWQVTPVGFGEPDRGQYDTITSCISCGGAMIVRSEIFEELGGFDSQFDPFGPEDMDFSLRLQQAGYQALYVPQAMGYHAVSHTFGSGYSEEYARHKSRHWYRFMRRHATPLQQLGFFLIGAPYLAIRVGVREGRKGNFGALRGLFRGLLDLVSPAKEGGKR